MAGESDEALMDSFRHGSDAAFDALYARHAQGVHAFLVRMVRDRALAEDLLQLTFLSVVRSKDRFEPGAKVVPWLLTIAANAARDALRRQKFAPVALPEGVSGRVEAEVGDVALRRRLEEALAKLPVSQREAVVLHQVEGWPFEDIANAFGITPTAARIRAHRGYERLRELLRGVWER